MNEFVTPGELARDLGLSPKTVRDYLRATYGLLANRSETRWQLTHAQADDVREYFSGRAI